MELPSSTTAQRGPLVAARPWLPSILLALAAVGLLTPWLNKAFDIDDPLFLWSAEQTLQTPHDFYGREINWYGAAAPMSKIVQNPPLQSFYLALVGKGAGFKELPLHLAMLIWSVAGVLGTYQLARQLTVAPAWAAAMTLCTPAFLVSATNVMCDVPMFAWWIWSLTWWVRGIQQRRMLPLLVAALCMSACAWTKYFGIAVVPLALLYGILERRNVGLWVATLCIPLAAAAALEAYMRWRYDAGAFVGAARYAITTLNGNQLAWYERGLVALLYFGGVLAPLLLVAPWLWSPRQQLAWGALTMLVAACFVGLGEIHTGNAENYVLRSEAGIAWGSVLQVTLFAIVGLQAFALLAIGCRRNRDATTWFLLAWGGGTFCFAAWLNWSINVRSLLPAVPAVAIVLARRWTAINEATEISASPGRAADSSAVAPVRRRIGATRGVWLALIPAAGLAVALCAADMRSANASRDAANELVDRYAPPEQQSRIWFAGHWGLQYYLERRGAIPIDLTGTQVRFGDLIVIPEDNPSGVLPADDWVLAAEHEEALVPWITTSSSLLQTSFYSSVIGPVPWRIEYVPPRRYRVYDPFGQLTGQSARP